uniref:Retroviral polymerase SH3-like domain-containing protein n=1 Tax=Physcomitrium patens TaxID=3218 RepID=A0A7I4DIM4_PHYPA
RSNRKITSKEMYLREKPNLDHLCILDVRYSSTSQRRTKKKLNVKVAKSMLVNYNFHPKAFRCYNPKTRKIVDMQDVKFNERIIGHMIEVDYIKIIKNPIYYAKNKHIKTHYHFIREKIISKKINVRYINTKEQVVNILTKILGKIKFKHFKQKLGLHSIAQAKAIYEL